MKTLKIISFIFITITFSSCYFLDYVIPEEYLTEDEPINTRYIWISHPSGIQCEVTFFNSLDQAIKSVTRYGINIYDSRISNYSHTTKCRTPTGTYYKLRIKYEDFGRLYGSLWKNTSNDIVSY